jgi:hypothetical protein
VQNSVHFAVRGAIVELCASLFALRTAVGNLSSQGQSLVVEVSCLQAGGLIAGPLRVLPEHWPGR